MNRKVKVLVHLAIGMAVVAAVGMRTQVASACGTCRCCKAQQESNSAAAEGSAVGQAVIFSEIMYNPAGSDRQTGDGGFNKEWVELYNTGDTTVNLAGWSIGDSQDLSWASPFPTRTLLAPGQAMVVTGDVGTFDSQWGQEIHRVGIDGFPTLSNSPSPGNETLALRDPSGAVWDQVNYDQANGWPRANGRQGASIFALPSGLSPSANDVGTNWAPSAWGSHGAVFRDVGGTNHGSPGYVATGPQGPFTPSPDAAWSMVVLPDTQNYSKWSTERHVFTRMTEWIRDNRDAFNIQAVLHEGDIVNNNNTGNPSSGNQTSTQQWQNAQASMHVLNGHVPYVLAAGNHDFGTTNAQNRQTFINDYFKPTDNPLVDPAQGGILAGVMNSGEIQNAYYEFTAPDGREMLILSLEWEPRPQTVAWANEVVSRPEFADHTAVLLTHAYLRGNNSRYRNSRVPEDASGDELWTDLVLPNHNIELVLNGHFGGDGSGRRSQTTIGGPVHELFFNTQFETQGGNGWLRVMEFLDDGTTVRVRTYSPYLDQFRTDFQFEFEFQITPLPLPTLAGDYNEDGIVDAADYVVWRDAQGTSSQHLADGDENGTVDHADYEIWKANFGTAASNAAGNESVAVPEPTGITCLLLATIVLSARLVFHRNTNRRFSTLIANRFAQVIVPLHCKKTKPKCDPC